ncbi:hypothetical protein RKD54_001942 [Pseudarthrobacter sp. SLBN-100]
MAESFEVDGHSGLPEELLAFDDAAGNPGRMADLLGQGVVVQAGPGEVFSEGLSGRAFDDGTVGGVEVYGAVRPDARLRRRNIRLNFRRCIAGFASLPQSAEGRAVVAVFGQVVSVGKDRADRTAAWMMGQSFASSSS